MSTLSHYLKEYIKATETALEWDLWMIAEEAAEAIQAQHENANPELKAAAEALRKAEVGERKTEDILIYRQYEKENPDYQRANAILENCQEFFSKNGSTFAELDYAACHIAPLASAQTCMRGSDLFYSISRLPEGSWDPTKLRDPKLINYPSVERFNRYAKYAPFILLFAAIGSMPFSWLIGSVLLLASPISRPVLKIRAKARREQEIRDESERTQYAFFRANAVQKELGLPSVRYVSSDLAKWLQKEYLEVRRPAQKAAEADRYRASIKRQCSGSSGSSGAGNDDYPFDQFSSNPIYTGPQLNTNGLYMIEGTGVDVAGNVYGATYY